LLSPEAPNEQTSSKGIPTEFVVVRWGRCIYLVPEADKEKFCDCINFKAGGNSGPRGDTYFRVCEGAKEVKGLPDVPKDWLPLLLKKPVHGKVIEVLEGRRARIDLGAESGVWKGMSFIVDTKNRNEDIFLKVTEVGDKTCVVAGKYPRFETISFKMGQPVKSSIGSSD
jgi:hypothetical protein